MATDDGRAGAAYVGGSSAKPTIYGASSADAAKGAKVPDGSDMGQAKSEQPFARKNQVTGASDMSETMSAPMPPRGGPGLQDTADASAADMDGSPTRKKPLAVRISQDPEDFPVKAPASSSQPPRAISPSINSGTPASHRSAPAPTRSAGRLLATDESKPERSPSDTSTSSTSSKKRPETAEGSGMSGPRSSSKRKTKETKMSSE
mmetsp:Transcript_147526/g.374731  ORF Transcript_147526/g.374731 Transcript_147526/m.374731 type:complete len:205 (+) Transcript_147526:1-615(+)